MTTNSKPKTQDGLVNFRLRDRDTGELVYAGSMDTDGQVELTEVGEGYIDLLKQIGVSVGNA